MPSNLRLVSPGDARDTAVRALSKVAPEQHAHVQVDLLMEADLRGVASHGLLRLPLIISRIREGLTRPESVGSHVWRAEGFLSVDGEQGLGPVVAEHAIAALSHRVGRIGVAIAAISNSNHLGMLGYYAEKVAEAGRTLIALSTSEALVRPWGGRKAMLGTNPIAIGIPTGGGPFMMDAATSVVSMGEIHDHANRGVAIPANWAVDAEGNPTTDPNAAKAGAIAPFGEAKGYALALAFELMISSLSGSAIGREVRGTLDDQHACNKGDLFILIDGPDRNLRPYLEEVRKSEPAAGFDRVMIPGERGRATRERRLREGLHLSDDVWTRIQALAA